jgi:GntR family transcriptional regulator
VLPFTIEIIAGGPIAEQIVFAVKRAVVSGQLRPGDKFPSVRVLSQELRINPNTAHRVVGQLVEQGVLVATPAVGTVVAATSSGGKAEKSSLLGAALEKLVVEAKRLGVPLEQVQRSLEKHWRELEKE